MQGDGARPEAHEQSISLTPETSLRILIISNFYPPFELGGWEQLAHDVRRQLNDRGHQTRVLTSKFGVSNRQSSDSDVLRRLYLQSADVEHYHPLYALSAVSHERRNLRELESQLEQFAPDVILIQGMWNLPFSLAKHAEYLMPGRVAYYIASSWPTDMNAHKAYWTGPAERAWLRLPKKAAEQISKLALPDQVLPGELRFDHVMCVSEFIRQYLISEAGVPGEQIKVVHNGVDPTQFKMREKIRSAPPLRFLYAGRLSPDKGVLTAIEARKKKFDETPDPEVTLSIVGGGASEYASRLENVVHAAGLDSKIRFVGQVDRHEMPSVMIEHDVLVFPSVWEEPLARVVQEAMASGLVVIGTVTGGTAEILRDGVTGLTFSPGDSDGLAARIGQLLDDFPLLTRLSLAGRQIVKERFHDRSNGRRD